MHLVYWIVAILISLNGCALFSGKEDETKEVSAGQLYKEAKEALKSQNYTKAAELYEKLQARQPFGVFAQQAQLDLAYAYYKSEESASAVAACDQFIKLYPTHPRVDYAYYLKGLANFNQGKGLAERYLPIDVSQRDQAAALKSFQDFTELIRRFPKSRYVEDAQKRMTYLRNLLAQHEVKVADYYMRRSAYVAAANRARYVVENYQGAPVMPEALVIMARAYLILEMEDLAEDALRVLELNYPNYPGIKEVQSIRLKE
jgi:outer membrane protein assembly factor BamD